MSTLKTISIQHLNGASPNIYLGNTGSVGVGVSSPQSKLHVAQEVCIDRTDAIQEGGELKLCRSSDNLSHYSIDVYGSGSTPSLRVLDNVAGAVRMSFDNSGRVTKPYQPSFSASIATSWSAPSGVNSIPLATTIHNIGSCFNTSTYRFTAPVAGRYLITGIVGTAGNTLTLTYFGLLIYRNGNQIVNGWQNKAYTTSSYVTDSKSLIVDLAVNDYMEFKLETQQALSVATVVICGELLS